VKDLVVHDSNLIVAQVFRAGDCSAIGHGMAFDLDDGLDDGGRVGGEVDAVDGGWDACEIRPRTSRLHSRRDRH